ncbi:hypothetical protein H6758_02100 [Candidatus Nomurabacteria bacterium]|nr:hypothetical protein [Candidatus Nomurabacteria bacterium]
MAKERNNGKVIAWVSLVIAIVALFVSYFAYIEPTSVNMAAKDVERSYEDAQKEVQEDYAVFKAQTQLWMIKMQIDTQEELQEAADDLEEVRIEMEMRAEKFGEASQARWVEFKEKIEELEQQARVDAAFEVDDFQAQLEELQLWLLNYSESK